MATVSNPTAKGGVEENKAADQGKDSLDDVLKLSVLKEDAKSELLEILESTRGRKAIFVDTNLIHLVQQIVVDGSPLLKDNGVHFMKDLKLNLQDLGADPKVDFPENVIYLVRPHLPSMKLIAQHIKGLNRFGVRSQFKVYFTPSQSTECLHLLEEHIGDHELWERVAIKEYRIGFVPLDSDILSLEMDYVFKQCYVDGDLSCLNIIATSLGKLQSIYGLIPHIKSKGVGAKKVMQRLLHKRVEDESVVQDKDANRPNGISSDQRSEIDTMIIVDREIDLVSPLITPLTYEGLVDDIIGIENGKIKVDASILGNDDSHDLSQMKMGQGTNVVQSEQKKVNPGDKITLTLNNNDSIFAEIRDLSIERIGSYMQEKAIHIRERYAAFKGNKDASLAEIHEFVKKIPKLTRDFKSLNQHIHIAELLKSKTDSRAFRDQWQGERAMLEGESYLDQIEELLSLDVDQTMLPLILKMLCLQSVTAGGIRGNRYDALRRTIIQTYGFEHLYTLHNLERSGLIRRRDGIIVVETNSVWISLRKQLRLIDERVNMSKPEDISYVAAGYAPLLVRLVQLLSISTGTNSTLIETLKLLPGPYLDFAQSFHPEELVDILARLNMDTGSNSTATSALQNVVNAATDIGALSTKFSSFRKDSEESRHVPSVLLDEVLSTKKTMLVVVIGGISYLEIAAFRFLSNDPNFPFKVILASTKVINGSTFIGSMYHTF